ncbi:hypothetical protein Tco_0835310, partial [Tanacetum coccineum]
MEQEVDRREDADTRGHKSESRRLMEELTETRTFHKISLKINQRSTKLQSTKEKKHHWEVLNDSEHEQASTTPDESNKAGKSWTILKRDSGWNKYADNGFVV